MLFFVCGNLLFALLHAFVARKQERLGLGVFLLTEQAGPQQTSSLAGLPPVWNALFSHRQTLAGQQFGLSKAFLRKESKAEVTERSGHVLMLIAQQFPPHRKGLAIHGFGLSELALFANHSSQVIERIGDIRVL